MLAPKYKWELQNLTPEVKLAQKLNLNPLILSILKNRGYKTQEQIKHFLQPTLNDLRSPFLIHDMQKGIERIKKAVANNEKITIYGDYDADGLTSTSIMYEALRDLDANVDYYIPNRFIDGYGPNTKAFTKIIKNGTSLIITVDNGISGYDQIEAANQLKCDVIITDHHDFPKKIPHAYAIIHARYPGHEYPFGDFSGAGIAFKIASALLNEIPVELLDLASIGTVADLVSLTDENRIIVKNGLKIMSETQRPGLRALIKRAGFNLARLNEENISFDIAPHLNALGRMGDANIGVKLLTTFDEDLSDKLAGFIESQNNKRKQLVEKITQAAQKQAASLKNRKHKTLVIAGENWHEGVVGIVASRIVEMFNKPTLILNIDRHKQTAKGSGRSVEGFNLFKALNEHRSDMISFGGHPMAVGLTIPEDKINAIRIDLEDASQDQHLTLNRQQKIKVAEKISIDDITMPFYYDLLQLAPFGTDNERPIFEINPISVSNVKMMGKKKNHLSLMAHGKNNFLKVVAFKKGKLANQIASMPNDISILGSISLNHWLGKDNLQIVLKDICGNGVSILDQRTKFLTQSMFNSGGLYIFFHATLMHKLIKYQNDDSKFTIYNNLPEGQRFDKIIFVDCPDRVSDLNDVLSKIKPSQITMYLYKHKYVAEEGIPNRPQFIKVFRLIQEEKQINLRNQLTFVATKLNISKDNVIFIIRLFIELNFVSVDHEVLILNQHLQPKSIQDAKLYHLRIQQIKTERQLLFQTTHNLILFTKNSLINVKKEVLN